MNRNNKKLKPILEKGREFAKKFEPFMEEITTNPPKHVINEISLSRIWGYTKIYDIAIISASRDENVYCIKFNEYEEGHKFTNEETYERTQELYAYLLEQNFGVTRVKGTWIENFSGPNSKEVIENSFFVINKNNNHLFFQIIIALGKHFCQDAVLLKSKDEEDAYLYGTNNNQSPGLDKKQSAGKFVGGVEGEYMTKAGKSLRPFIFKENYNVMARWLIHKSSEKLRISLNSNGEV